MEPIYQWGINLIIAIQQIHGPILDSIFRVITFLGEEQFYLVALPLVLWCFEYSFGAVLAIFFLLSTSVNIILKDLFKQPRPFDLNPALKLSDAEGYGLPSGHAQLSVVAWGAVALRLQKAWFWVVAVLLMILIAFSRIYLGVHFPTDVFAGWVIGIILLLIYSAIKSPLEKWLEGLPLWLQLVIAAAIPLLLVLIDHGAEALTSAGTLFGMGIGFVLARRYVLFDAAGVWWRRVLRFVAGLIVVLALYSGLKAAFPPDPAALGPAFRFVRYTLIGLWVTLGAPWVFKLMKLA